MKLKTSYQDLVFRPHVYDKNGVAAVMFYPNGYGISVIRTSFSYGREDGLYAAVVLKGNEEKFNLDYSTSIADDVMGSLSPNEISYLMKKVSEL